MINVIERLKLLTIFFALTALACLGVSSGTANAGLLGSTDNDFSTTPKPDLIVIFGSATGDFKPGGSVTANITLMNSSSGSTLLDELRDVLQTFYTRYYLSADSNISTSDTYLASDTTYGLEAAATGSESATFTLPANLTPGKTYYIGALVDYNGQVSESDESNNSRILKSFEVASSSAADYTYYLPGFTSENNGWTGLALGNENIDQSANVEITVYGFNGLNGSILYETEKNLPAGGYASFPVAGETSDNGWIYIESTQPLSGLAFFSADGNRMADIPFVDQPEASLMIPHIAVNDFWSTNVLLCNPQTETVTVSLSIVGSQGDIVVQKSVDLPARGGANYALADFFENADLSGKLYLEASDKIAAFALYDGGSYYAGINATAVTGGYELKTDLSILTNTFKLSGDFTSGGLIETDGSLLITNNGVATAEFDIVFYLSTNDTITSSDTRLISFNAQGMSAKGIAVLPQASFELPALQSSQTYYIVAVVDAWKSVEESNETNNTAIVKTFKTP
ncbi:MAG: hypothetical protein JXQ81_03630 [Desulfuromonadales bacterium]|nr:hypothetical protein [Desulfuromonadales bacterium]